MNIPVIKSNYKELNDLLLYSYLPRIINSAVEIELFEVLKDDEKTLEEILAFTNTSAPITEALLNLLCLINMIKRNKDKYQITDLTKDFLLKDSGANQIHSIKMFTGSPGYFDNLTEMLKNGPEKFDIRMWATKEGAYGIEQQAKAGKMQAVLAFLKTIPEFFQAEKMCDLAGNTGYYSLAMNDLNNKLISYIYELPELCEIGREIRKKEIEEGKLNFVEFDLQNFTDLGENFDLFFCSHFFYEIGANDKLTEFLKKINKALKPGGILISNHIASIGTDITMAINDLMTKAMGYPTHELPEAKLKAALKEAGFGNFRQYQTIDESIYPALLLAATKISE